MKARIQSAQPVTIGMKPADERLTNLVRQAARGDGRAFQALADRMRPVGLRYATRILKDRDHAEDAVQEALLDTFRLIGTVRRPENFRSWFHRVVFKHCDRIRRRRDYTTIATDAAALQDAHAFARSGEYNSDLLRHNPELQWMQAEEVATIRKSYRRAQARLALQEKRLARLYFEENASHARIAHVLDWPVHTVKNRIRILRRKLRHHMRDTQAVRDTRTNPVNSSTLSAQIPTSLAYMQGIHISQRPGRPLNSEYATAPICILRAA
ncbi:MAG: sigma-70 family RNA polymerase sigma factor [Leptospiraceae bacterium]|nr:sigma-70 family RNA polymerase sigma factor [Leptospiraceae bacterium]